MIATDAVFSMDGDLAPLPQLLELAKRYECWLYVDDAHGFGVLGQGKGSLAHFGLDDEQIIYMGTLGKAAGVMGAFVAADSLIVELLLQTAKTYIYTTAMPPALAQALLQSLKLIEDGENLRHRLIGHKKHLAALLGLAETPSAIVPLLIGDADAAVKLSEALWAERIFVPAIRPPTVPQGASRLRISLSAAHSDEDIDCLGATLRHLL